MRYTIKSGITLVISSLFVCGTAAIARDIHYCPPTDTSQQDIANAIQASPTVPQSIKNSACGYAAMATQEAPGTVKGTADMCLGNDCCTGVLQVYSGGLKGTAFQGDKAGYANATLQQQIDIWGRTAASNITSQGYKTLNAAYQNGQTVGGRPVTAGTLAACEQFGPGQCNQNVAAMQQGTGTCGTGVNGNPTICQWGKSMDKIASKGACSDSGGCSSSPQFQGYPDQKDPFDNGPVFA